VVFATERGEIEIEAETAPASVSAANFLKYMDRRFRWSAPAPPG
jgi:hypothetical protein